ncbi:hypothetical protein SAMN05428969_1754 [Devosia sp. YR412]|uniref:type II toxin-antitoxin system VapC family toxin n=1 Tax=Devosia sp. YR412 TaxID=1881030 RepID=UPI0008CA1449|nr:type II toxin-antitoxin system VapC family toxin [Devosia sp. YR412]SEQ05855.1 hypothetical protein SAMN05428969_1754 [Devosia sp. YR412]
MILVDTNVILDLVTADPVWHDWSKLQMRQASLKGPLIINAAIYAELAPRYDTMAQLDELAETLEDMPRKCLFLAGQAFRRYRSQGGRKTGVLPDFFIGAHAAAASLPLLTRDRSRYATYFPDVTLIAPGR